MPTRDRPEWLREALESVLAQDWQDWECVVVDDGGRAPAVVPDDARFRLIRNEHSRGPAAARNVALAAALGEHIALLDDDDLLAPQALSSLLAATAPGVVVFGQAEFLGEETRVRPAGRWQGHMGGAILDDPPTHVMGFYPRK